MVVHTNQSYRDYKFSDHYSRINLELEKAKAILEPGSNAGPGLKEILKGYCGLGGGPLWLLVELRELGRISA